MPVVHASFRPVTPAFSTTASSIKTTADKTAAKKAMGFLKRLFSKSGKHSKKSKTNTNETTPATPNKPLPSVSEDDADATLNRLLRSGSTMYKVRSSHDLLAVPTHASTTSRSSIGRSSTPPLSLSSKHSRHPSTATRRSPASPAPSSAYSTISSRAYSVVVHERTVHTPARLSPSPSFNYGNSAASSNKRKSPDRSPTPLALRGLVFEQDNDEENDEDESAAARKRRRQSARSIQSDKSQLIRLRKDPSVATLLNMYDSAGGLDDAAFDSPDKAAAQPLTTGKVQRQRTGSTLRELLGDEGAGDLSWAERLLGETSAMGGSKESLASVSPFKQPEPTFFSDLSGDKSADMPDVPSLDVEVSDRSHGSISLSELGHLNKPIQNGNESFALLEKPSFIADTPFKSGVKRATSVPAENDVSPVKQPASEVFAFLMQPRKPKQSTVSLEAPAYTPSVPPVPPPPPADISRYLAPVSRSNSFVRSGPTGRLFATGPPVSANHPPSAYTAQRSRSASTSAADMLGSYSSAEPQGHPAAHRRSTTITQQALSPPAEPQNQERVERRMSQMSTASSSSTLAAIRGPRGPRPLSRGTSMSLGPAEVLAHEELQRASSSSNSNRPMSRGQSLGPADMLAHEARRSRTPTDGMTVGSSKLDVPRAGSSGHKRSHSKTADIPQAQRYLSPEPSAGRPPKHRRTSSKNSAVSALSDIDMDAPELAEVRVAVRSQAHHQTARVVVPPPVQTYAPQVRHGQGVRRATSAAPTSSPRRNKENANAYDRKYGSSSTSTAKPMATLRAVTPPANLALYVAEEDEADRACGAIDVRDLPMTPVRTRALRVLGDQVSPGKGDTSGELSPVGKEIMRSVRERKATGVRRDGGAQQVRRGGSLDVRRVLDM